MKTRPSVKRQYFEANRVYRGYNRSLYSRYVTRIQNSLRSNPKRFWTFVDTKRKERGLPSKMFLNDNVASNAAEKCNLFKNHFSGVFDERTPTSDEIQAAVEDLPANVFDLDVFTITEDMVIEAVKKVKTSYCPGPDGIPTCIFKNCLQPLLTPLTMLLNLSMQQMRFPTAWKTSCMVPVFKKGDKKDVGNYRGITSLCAGSKLFETIVNKLVFAATKHYISDRQHGFYPTRSVDTNLIVFTSSCISQLDRRRQVDAIYTDIKAAFDTVNHSILLAKFERLGATKRFCVWLESYLVNRRVFVKIGSAESAYFVPPSGVPQGSNFGPRLFSVHFNDVSLAVTECDLLMYADDLKLYATVEDISDGTRLQRALGQLSEWCTRNYLLLSIGKCFVMTFCRRKDPIVCEYSIDGLQLQRVDRIKDLGVLLDSQLTFKLHYSLIIDKANRQLGFMLRIATEFKDPFCLCTLYRALVRTILEFASTVWSPYEGVWILRIEAVQRRFVRQALRHLPWQNHQRLTPYEMRCNLLQIDTVSRRRSINQAVFAAKILLGEIDCPPLLAQLQLYAPERALRSRRVLQQDQRRTLFGFNDPISSISRRLQESYHLFDFNENSNKFRQKLVTSSQFRPSI